MKFQFELYSYLTCIYYSSYCIDHAKYSNVQCHSTLREPKGKTQCLSLSPLINGIIIVVIRLFLVQNVKFKYYVSTSQQAVAVFDIGNRDDCDDEDYSINAYPLSRYVIAVLLGKIGKSYTFRGDGEFNKSFRALYDPCLSFDMQVASI